MGELAVLTWVGDEHGHLKLSGPGAFSVACPADLEQALLDTGGRLGDAELELLGGLALLLCVREVRVGRAGAVLPIASRVFSGLDLGPESRAAPVARGFEALRAKLEPMRGEPHHVLSHIALAILRREPLLRFA